MVVVRGGYRGGGEDIHTTHDGFRGVAHPHEIPE